MVQVNKLICQLLVRYLHLSITCVTSIVTLCTVLSPFILDVDIILIRIYSDVPNRAMSIASEDDTYIAAGYPTLGDTTSMYVTVKIVRPNYYVHQRYF